MPVVPGEVVRSFRESGAWRKVMQGGVGAVEVIVVEVEREEGGAVEAGEVRAGIGPTHE
jgi:hypothetical protein